MNMQFQEIKEINIIIPHNKLKIERITTSSSKPVSTVIKNNKRENLTKMTKR